MFKKIILVLLVIITITDISKSQNLVLTKLLNASGGLYASPTNTKGFFIKSSIGQLAIEKKVTSNKSDLVIYNGYWSRIGSSIKSSVDFDNVPEYMHIANTPNPFSNQTNINYELIGMAKVELLVYDANGNQITQLVNGIQEKGNHLVTFNASMNNGTILSSGTYFYELKVSPIAIGEQYFEAYSIRNVMVLVK